MKTLSWALMNNRFARFGAVQNSIIDKRLFCARHYRISFASKAFDTLVETGRDCGKKWRRHGGGSERVAAMVGTGEILIHWAGRVRVGAILKPRALKALRHASFV